MTDDDVIFRTKHVKLKSMGKYNKRCLLQDGYAEHVQTCHIFHRQNFIALSLRFLCEAQNFSATPRTYLPTISPSIFIAYLMVFYPQILILILTRYMQTSIDTAYRWGNPLLSAPGFLFNTSQPPRPDVSINTYAAFVVYRILHLADATAPFYDIFYSNFMIALLIAQMVLGWLKLTQ